MLQAVGPLYNVHVFSFSVDQQGAFFTTLGIVMIFFSVVIIHHGSSWQSLDQRLCSIQPICFCVVYSHQRRAVAWLWVATRHLEHSRGSWRHLSVASSTY